MKIYHIMAPQHQIDKVKKWQEVQEETDINT